MALATQQTIVPLEYVSGDACEVSTLTEITSETCLNIGNPRTSRMAISLLDCRMEVNGKGRTKCFLSRDADVVICPRGRAEYLSTDVLETILQLFDACKSSSIDAQKEYTIILSSELLQLTKETITSQSHVQKEFKRILDLTGELNSVLEDSLIVGKELQQHTNSFRNLNSSLQDILKDVQATSIDGFPNWYKTTKDVMRMDLNSILSIASDEELRFSNHGRPKGPGETLQTLFELERTYSIFCTCLFVCLLARSLGNVAIAFFALTALNVMKTVISNGDTVSFATETVVSHVVLLVLLLSCKGNDKQTPKSTKDPESHGSNMSVCTGKQT